MSQVTLYILYCALLAFIRSPAVYLRLFPYASSRLVNTGSVLSLPHQEPTTNYDRENEFRQFSSG